RKRVDAERAKRSRILSDEEIRAVWRAAEADRNVFGAFARIALLTGQRRTALVEMKWRDLDGDVWHMPVEPRAKGVGGDLKLPPLAMSIINSLPRIHSCLFVFHGRARRDGRFNSFAKSKSTLDKASGATGWRIHDLRRTSRSLMSRAGVSSEHAERGLGHTIGGVEGIYD